MNAKPVIGSRVAVVIFLALCGGCVETWKVENEQRAAVQFASPVAAQTFYEAYIAKNYTKLEMSTEPGFGVGVPLRWPYERHEYSTDNVYFNAAVSAADTNHDGVISDEEARNYSAGVHRLPKDLVAVAKQ